MHAKIPNTRAPRQTSATRNGRPNAISTDPTRRCNANPTELILGNTLNASTKSFCTQFNDVNCIYSKSIFTSYGGWSTAASATARKANAFLAPTGTRRKSATK